MMRDGRLLGSIISNSGVAGGERGCRGTIPREDLAAPVWLVRQMVPRPTARKLAAALPLGRWRRDIRPS